MRKWEKDLGLVIGATLCFAFTTSAAAPSIPTFFMEGSDTLFDPISRAISLFDVHMRYVSGGSRRGEADLLEHRQGIAPMSRNLAASIIGPGGSHPGWAPRPEQIVALDAVLVVQRASPGMCRNIQESRDAAGNPATHWLKLILGGVDGTGSAAACSHPARLDALQALADCMSVDQLDHFFRPDDNSGTTDTLAAKLGICSFCNGRAVGPLNTDNSDGDPVRRDCVSPTSSEAATPCTGGTLGVVVALSQLDPGTSNVATSIARRIVNDPLHQVVGFSGREALLVAGATKMNINGSVPSVENVRSGSYDFWRRLFLQRGDMNDPSVMADDPTGEQDRFFAWTTGIGSDRYPELCGTGSCGRPNMDPLMKQFGFVTCLDDPYDTPVPPNPCATSPAPFASPVCQ